MAGRLAAARCVFPNAAAAVRSRLAQPDWYHPPQREIFIDNLLARVHFIIVMIRWTGLAPCEFEFPLPGSLTFTFLDPPPYAHEAGTRIRDAKP